MNILLDVKTTFLLLGVGHAFTLILISAYWRHHTKDITIKAFLLAKCAQTATWILITLRGEIPDFLSISVANSLLFVGASFEIIAILSMQNILSPAIKKTYLLLTALSIVGFQLILLLYNYENVRIAFVSIVTSLLILPVYRIFQDRTPTLLMKIMGFLYLFVIVASWVRGGAALLPGNTIYLFSVGIFQTVAFLSMYLVMILGNTGFVLLLKERSDQELIRLASYDDLTGALNRRTFAIHAERFMAEHAKHKNPLSYLLFDIDSFKTINDTYGHHVGDQVIRDLATQIKHHLGDDDLFVRYGGDEFGVLLPGKDEAESNEIADKMKQAIDGASKRGLPVSYTISIGVLTTIPDSHTQLETLYTTCDKALYHAKNNGRNVAFRS